MGSIYRKIAAAEDGRKKSALCIITSTKGSTPRKTGAKLLVFEDEKIEGTIGGGALEQEVIRQALEVIGSQQPMFVKHNLVNELGMCCGGSVEVFIEPVVNRKKLYIFGAGHIGKALAGYATGLDFNVTLVDERYEAFDDFDAAEVSVIKEHHHTAIEEHLDFDENTFVVIVTHNHAYDREILALTAKKKIAYVGMIGSQRKVEIAKKNLLSNNLLSKSEIDQVDMPIGLEIKVETPAEIAISILGKLIDVRNKITKKTKQ